MNIDRLKELGLTESESRTYVALLRMRHVHAGKISKAAQLNRTTTYDALERLIEKGLVTHVIESNRKTFQPVHPSKLIDRAKNMEETASEIVPELIKMYDEYGQPAEDAAMYRGKKGIKSILSDMLRFPDYVAMGPHGPFFETMKHDFISFQKRKIERGVKPRVILDESGRGTTEVQIGVAEFRFIPDKYAPFTHSFAYGDQ
ncbi:MAG: helix-turn-helix domain-containing protein, partial [archaeon]